MDKKYIVHDKPYWYILTKLLKSKGIITTGLTIPYLFGAYKILGYQFKGIRELFDTILNSNVKEYPVIEKCDVIKHDVVRLESKEICNRWAKKELRFPSDKTQNILFISSNTKLGSSPEKICVSLSTLYQKPIDNETYSWDNGERGKGNGKWKKFTLEETELILSIK